MRVRLTLLALLICGTGLWGDGIIPGHFTINLNSPLGCDPNTFEGYCNSQWGGPTFTLHYFDVAQSLDGFTNPFNPCGDCEDPDMELDLGGNSFGIDHQDQTVDTSNEEICPDNICSLKNDTGVDWQALMLTTAFTSNFSFETFLCGSNAFDSCGFKVDGNNLDVLFTGVDHSPGIVPAPEPSYTAMFGTFLVLMAWIARRRARRA